MSRVVPRISLSSKDMRELRIKDINKLREVLENLSLMAPVYKHFLSPLIIRARLMMYPHSDGVIVKDMSRRQWVYVRLENINGMVYDAALWKIINFASSHSKIFHEIMKHVEVE